MSLTHTYETLQISKCNDFIEVASITFLKIKISITNNASILKQ